MGVKIQASITFLGTGQGSFVIGRQLLSSGGFVLQVGENQFHVDPGPSALSNAAQYGVNVRATTALLVSHAHLNHANDLNAVIDAMTYSGFDKRGILVADDTTVNGAEKYTAPLSPFYRDFLERFIVLRAGQRVGINEIEILALKTRHSEPNAIGFKFFTPKFTLSYSSDTKYSQELIEEYKNSNVLILNVPHLTKEEAKDNLCMEDAIKIIKEINPRLAVIQHFGVEMVKADPLFQIRKIQMETRIQTIAAKDGMVINLDSYSVDKGQRTLQAFPRERQAEIKEEMPRVTVVEMSEKEAEVEKAEEIKEEQKELPEEDILNSDKPLKDLFEDNNI